MKLFRYAKDGGAESTVSGFFLVEIKSLFSVALLRFGHGSRDAYHSYSFNSISWVLRGMLMESFVDRLKVNYYFPSLRPIITRRSDFHQVYSYGTTWVLTFRGFWSRTWNEYIPNEARCRILTHGRQEVAAITVDAPVEHGYPN